MRSVLALLLLGSVAAAQSRSPEAADALHRKAQVIIRHASEGQSAGRRTIVTEAEVNSYLHYRIAPTLPAGVTEPSLVIVGDGRLNGRAVVDLDQVRQRRSSGGWLDPTAYLTGKLPVTASGILKSGNGSAQFELESAELSGVPIPKVLLEEIVAFYTRSADQPNGVSIDEPFALPAAIKQIEIGRGQAVVVQ